MRSIRHNSAALSGNASFPHKKFYIKFWGHAHILPPPLRPTLRLQTMRAQMDQHQHYHNGGRISTAIPALKWPPTRNVSLVRGYPGSSNSYSRAGVEPSASFPSASSVLLQCAVLRSSPPVGAIARGVGEQQPAKHKKSRCSSRANKGMMVSRSAGGGGQPTTLSREGAVNRTREAYFVGVPFNLQCVHRPGCVKSGLQVVYTLLGEPAIAP